MNRRERLRGERPIDALEYQQPTQRELFIRVRELETALERVLANSDPLPPCGVEVHVAAQQVLECR